MTESWHAKFERHGNKVEIGFVVVTLTLFFFGSIRWLGMLPGGRDFQPTRFVLLTGALALQHIAALVQRRSRRLGFALLGVSVVLLGAAFVVRY